MIKKKNWAWILIFLDISLSWMAKILWQLFAIKSFQKAWHYLVLKRFHCYFVMVDMRSIQSVMIFLLWRCLIGNMHNNMEGTFMIIFHAHMMHVILITSIINIWFLFCLTISTFTLWGPKKIDVFNCSWTTPNYLKLYVDNLHNVLHSFILRLFSNFVGTSNIFINLEGLRKVGNTPFTTMGIIKKTIAFHMLMMGISHLFTSHGFLIVRGLNHTWSFSKLM